MLLEGRRVHVLIVASMLLQDGGAIKTDHGDHKSVRNLWPVARNETDRHRALNGDFFKIGGSLAFNEATSEKHTVETSKTFFQRGVFSVFSNVISPPFLCDLRYEQKNIYCNTSRYGAIQL